MRWYLVWVAVLVELLVGPAVAAPGPRSSAFGEAGAPAAPTNLIAQPGSQNSIHLFWKDNATNESEYRIEMRTLTTPYREIFKATDDGGIVPGLAPDAIYIFRIRAYNEAGFSAYSNEAAGATLAPPVPCVSGPQTLCLLNGIYEVQAHWKTPQGQLGMGQAFPLTSDTGAFWFFTAENIEMIVKVLDGCAVNRFHWVFAGGLTNVEVVWTVTDTRVGVPQAYLNPIDRSFVPVQDTAAFRGCP